MIVKRTTTYAVCPQCGEDAGIVDHLLGQTTWTAWYCDSCGQRYGLDFKADGTVGIEAMPERIVKTFDLLILEPQEHPVYFIVEGMRFEGTDDNRSPEHAARFHYEEHSCPTNWLKPEVVYYKGDTDPHGLIEFVATRDAGSFPSDDNPVGPNAHDDALVAFIEEHKK